MANDSSIDPFQEWRASLVRWAPPGRDESAGQDADGWASSAKWFRATRQSFDAGHDPFLRFLAPWLADTSTVLDIGAGAGRLSLPIAKKVRRVIAVEASPAMRDVLEEGINSEGLKNIDVVAGRWPDAEAERAELAICANVLYDVADLRPFLTKLDMVADRACFIYLTERHPYDSFRELWREFRGWQAPDKPTYEDAIRCIERLGIKPNIEVTRSSRTMSFADLEQGVAFAQRRLGLPDDPDLIQKLRTFLAKRGQQKDDKWVPGWGPSRGVILWWEKK